MSACQALSQALERGGEAAITVLFQVELASESPAETRIPLDKRDTVVYEFPFRFGRADIVVFHIDGSASVIEVKDGTKGYKHVVGGIGQAGLYAAQLMMKGGVRRVRRCLLWTSTGDVEADIMIELACLKADAVPLPWGRLSDHLAATREVVEQHVGVAA